MTFTRFFKEVMREQDSPRKRPVERRAINLIRLDGNQVANANEDPYFLGDLCRMSTWKGKSIEKKNIEKTQIE